MHAQNDVEALPGNGSAHLGVRRTAFVLVENDKLDVADVAEQSCFGSADDPRELRIGPVVAEIAGHGQGVTGITDRRQPYQADALRRGCGERPGQEVP